MSRAHNPKVAPLADVPCLPELSSLVRLKYLTPVNRWTGLDIACGLLRAATADERERSLVWRELLSGYDVGDVASVVFRDRFGCWGFLDLWRTGASARFTEDEAAFLTEVAGAVTEGLRRCQAHTFAVAEGKIDRTGPVVIILSPQLQVGAQTPETEEYLRVLVPPEADGELRRMQLIGASSASVTGGQLVRSNGGGPSRTSPVFSAAAR